LHIIASRRREAFLNNLTTLNKIAGEMNGGIVDLETLFVEIRYIEDEVGALRARINVLAESLGLQLI
jgi:hypothetical protein